MSTVFIRRFVVVSCFAGALSHPLRAQPSAPPPSAASKDEAITLSVFEVHSEKDIGYQAANTTSGSRLNTPLKDTAAAISPFTKEFIDDIGVTNLGDMMRFVSGYEPEFQDGEGFNSLASRRADTTNAPFRIRGQTGGVSVDLSETGVPIDLADIERVEIASGPNSILFGTAATGGITSLSTKRAQTNRTANSFRGIVGSWDLSRGEVDLNQVIKKDVVAFRLFGFYSNREGYRHWDFEDSKRMTGAVTVHPWKATTISASYGEGLLKRHNNQPLNGGDQITLWRALGSQASDTANLAGAGISSIANVNRYTFDINDGVIYNLRNKMTTRGNTSVDVNDQRLLAPSVMPFDYSFAGPSARYSSDFNNLIARLEQKVGDHLVVEAAYQKNRADNFSESFQLTNNMMNLQGDPNVTVPLLSGGTAPNPRSRQLYMETNWRPETALIKNEVARLTAAYGLEFANWGSHRIAGLYEHATLDRNRNDNAEILVDDSGVPISNATAPENNANLLWRRNYVTEGDFTTYNPGSLRIAPPNISVGGKTYHLRTVGFSNVGNTADQRITDSYMLALQSYWLKRKLVTTVGYRIDKNDFHEGVTARISPTDPRVLSGQKVANEWIAVDGQETETKTDFNTKTFGAVYHFTPRFSGFYNWSSNVGTPRFDRTVIPGVLPHPSRGRGQDGGVMIDFLGDERYFARLTYFNTTQLGDASISPAGVGIESNYYTDGINNILTYLQTQGRITQAEFDAQHQGFSALTIDLISKGAELEFVANPTSALTLRLAGSLTHTDRSNYFSEREPYLSNSLAFIRAHDDKGVMSNGQTVEQAIASLLAAIQNAATNAEGASTGARAFKGNLTARYKFTQGRLKGAFVGGAFLYEGPPLISDDATTGKKIFGVDVQQVNLFAGYAFRAPFFQKSTLRLQLNVNNVGNRDRVQPGRYTNDNVGLRRVYLRDPRNYRLTGTVEF